MPKSGFVVLIGRTNVGKSTLLNALVGSKIAITSPKPQTTRLPIQGVLTRRDGQIVFVDTPGIFMGSKDTLSKKMNVSIQTSLNDVDVIAHIVDPTREIGAEEHRAIRLMKSIEKPKILIINKIDVQKKPFIEFYRDLANDYTAVVEVSALKGTHVRALIETLFQFVPEGEFYYPEFQLTNMSNKVWLAELIREKLFLRLRQELPYTIHVEVSEIAERDNGVIYIAATIFTTSDRYKGMIIGAGGRGVREIGQSTRKELEAVMGTRVFLDLTVEVDPHWMQRFE